MTVNEASHPVDSAQEHGYLVPLLELASTCYSSGSIFSWLTIIGWCARVLRIAWGESTT